MSGLTVGFDVDISKTLKKLEHAQDIFAEGGAVQRYIDSKVITICDPYVPYSDGKLKQSAIDNTVIGSGEVVYVAPYARAHYYAPYDRKDHKDADGQYNPQSYGKRTEEGDIQNLWNWGKGGVQEGGKRGHYWVDRAMEDGGMDKLTNGVNTMVKRELK